MFNRILITEKGTLVLNDTHVFPYSDVKKMLRGGYFTTTINCLVGGPNSDFTGRPSRKTINRLINMLIGTRYTITDQQDHHFTLELMD